VLAAGTSLGVHLLVAHGVLVHTWASVFAAIERSSCFVVDKKVVACWIGEPEPATASY